MDKDYFIVTNNPELKEHELEKVFVKGSFEDVLVKVRDLIHLNNELVSHPLGASIRIMYSPYRSVLMSRKKSESSQSFNDIIEGSLATYRKNTSHRKIDLEHAKDYAMIDMQLLSSAIEEIKEIRG